MFTPNIAPKPSLTKMMMWVFVALIPAVVAQTYFWGPAVWMQLLLGSITAVVVEAVCLKLCKKRILFHLKDGTAVLTAWLLALSIPPFAPWFVIVVGTALALVLSKQAFGGMGQNIFNPAMVGFALVIIAFPGYLGLYSHPFSQHGVEIILGFKSLPDAWASATPLDVLKNAYRQGVSWDTVYKGAEATYLLVLAKSVISVAYFLGGLVLIWKKIIKWWVPFLYIGIVGIWTVCFVGLSDGMAAPVWLLLSQGAIVMAAFFIITDPVTAPVSSKGMVIFIVLCASLTFIIRTWGNFPDGVAFAVLFSNLCTPMIDRLTVRRVFGIQKKQVSK